MYSSSTVASTFAYKCILKTVLQANCEIKTFFILSVTSTWNEEEENEWQKLERIKIVWKRQEAYKWMWHQDSDPFLVKILQASWDLIFKDDYLESLQTSVYKNFNVTWSEFTKIVYRFEVWASKFDYHPIAVQHRIKNSFAVQRKEWRMNGEHSHFHFNGRKSTRTEIFS